MSASSTEVTIRPEHRPTVDMVRAAFPNGIPGESYQPLLALLCERMSFRAAAVVVSYLTAKDRDAVYHDVLGAMEKAESGVLEAHAFNDVREKLRAHGYDAWVADEN